MFMQGLKNKVFWDTNDAGGGAAPAATTGEEPQLGQDNVGGAPAAAPAAPEPPAQDPPKPDDKPWYEKAIGKKTAQLNAARGQLSAKDARIAQLEAEMAALKAPAPGAAPATPAAAPAKPAMSHEALEAEISARAAALAAQQSFAQRVDAVAAAGVAAHTDFHQVLGQLNSLVDFADPASAGAFANLVDVAISAASETKPAHEILYEIAQNPDKAERLLSLTPAKLGVEIARMATPTAIISNAPGPIQPIRKGNTVLPINPADPDRADQMTTADWIAQREAQIAAKQART